MRPEPLLLWSPFPAAHPCVVFMVDLWCCSAMRPTVPLWRSVIEGLVAERTASAPSVPRSHSVSEGLLLGVGVVRLVAASPASASESVQGVVLVPLA